MASNSANFIKLFRKMMYWKWYKNANTKALFLHCLLRANWESGSWMGIHYEAGQFITSISSLSNETGLSQQQVRTALNHLKDTDELTVQTITQKATQKATRQSTQRLTAKCSLITVNNWAKYQGVTQKSTQRATRKATTVKEYKEIEDAASLPNGMTAASEEDDSEWEWLDAYDERDRVRRERNV